jgi:hypothetical protein
MTPKEKAIELYNKFIPFTDVDISNSQIEVYNTKQCALIAVDELIKEKNKWENGSFYTSKYWDYVKQEIEKL